MPAGLYEPFRYGVVSYHFVEEEMYVWVATLMRLEDRTVAKLCSAILSDALQKHRQFTTDLLAVPTKATIGILSVGINPGLEPVMSHQLKVIECSIWPEGQGDEPRPCADLYFGRRASSPVVRAVLETRAALAARDLEIDRQWNWLTWADYHRLCVGDVPANDNQRR